MQAAPARPEEKVSDELERWLKSDGPNTLGSLIELFEERSFAIVFVILMAIPALPLPTGGATHVFEVITVLLALQLVVGRDEIWLPQRWRRREIASAGKDRFVTTLIRRIRNFERFSRPRGSWFLDNRLAGVFFGLTVIALTIVAFFAPPFSGLDTLPALGVVMLSLGFLLEDAILAGAGVVVGALGVVLVVGLGTLVTNWIGGLF
jgi:hypothetical protein